MSRIWGLSDGDAPPMGTPSRRRGRSPGRTASPSLAVQLLRLAAVVMVISVGLGLWNLRVGEVSLRGVRLADREATRAVASELLQQRWVTADLDGVAKNLRQLPWVASVRVRRVVPSNVEIEVEERTPLFRYLDDEGNLRLLSADGTLLVPPSSLDASPLVTLDPPRVGSEGLSLVDRDRLTRLMKAMRDEPWPLDRPWHSLDLRGPGGVTLRLADGTEIWLGEVEFGPRLRRLRASQEQWRDQLPGRIDLRFSGQIIVAANPATSRGG